MPSFERRYNGRDDSFFLLLNDRSQIEAAAVGGEIENGRRVIIVRHIPRRGVFDIGFFRLFTIVPYSIVPAYMYG